MSVGLGGLADGPPGRFGGRLVAARMGRQKGVRLKPGDRAAERFLGLGWIHRPRTLSLGRGIPADGERFDRIGGEHRGHVQDGRPTACGRGQLPETRGRHVRRAGHPGPSVGRPVDEGEQSVPAGTDARAHRRPRRTRHGRDGRGENTARAPAGHRSEGGHRPAPGEGRQCLGAHPVEADDEHAVSCGHSVFRLPILNRVA